MLCKNSLLRRNYQAIKAWEEYISSYSQSWKKDLQGKNHQLLPNLVFPSSKKPVIFVFTHHEFSTWWRPLCSICILEWILFFWTANCSQQELCLARCLSRLNVAGQVTQVLCATSRTNTWVCQSPKFNQTPKIQLWNAACVTGQRRKLKLCFFNSTSVPQCTQLTPQSLWFFPSFSSLFSYERLLGFWEVVWVFGGVCFGYFFSKFSSTQDLKPNCSNVEPP